MWHGICGNEINYARHSLGRGVGGGSVDAGCSGGGVSGDTVGEGVSCSSATAGEERHLISPLTNQLVLPSG